MKFETIINELTERRDFMNKLGATTAVDESALRELLSQQQEIAKLKAELTDLNEHDDEITGIETTNQELSTLADARINKLVDENNELKAQANALRESLSKNQEWVRCGIGGNCSGYPKDHKDYIAITDLLNKTPAQCLQSVKADEIDRVKNEITVASYNAELDQDDIINYLDEESTRVREGES